MNLQPNSILHFLGQLLIAIAPVVAWWLNKR